MLKTAIASKKNSNLNCKKIEILFVFYIIEWPTPSTATPSTVQIFLMLQNFMEATVIDINKLLNLKLLLIKEKKNNSN